MVLGRNKHSQPRAVGGGRSPRYEERRKSRGGSRRYAPEWSDAAAAAIMRSLNAESKGRVANYVGNWLTSQVLQERTLAASRLSPADKDLARRVLAYYANRAVTEADRLRAVVKSFLKPLRERQAYREDIRQLVVEPAVTGPGSFHAWLSPRPDEERLRDISRSKRILLGLKGWPLQWLHTAGVVCFERAAGRLRQERSGRADEAFLRGVVKTVELATATANSSDHYVLLSPGKEPRFLTVEEVMRAFSVCHRGALYGTPSS